VNPDSITPPAHGLHGLWLWIPGSWLAPGPGITGRDRSG